MSVLPGASHQMAGTIHNDNFCLCTLQAENEARVNSIASLPQSSSPSVASKLFFFPVRTATGLFYTSNSTACSGGTSGPSYTWHLFRIIAYLPLVSNNQLLSKTSNFSVIRSI